MGLTSKNIEIFLYILSFFQIGSRIHDRNREICVWPWCIDTVRPCILVKYKHR